MPDFGPRRVAFFFPSAQQKGVLIYLRKSSRKILFPDFSVGWGGKMGQKMSTFFLSDLDPPGNRPTFVLANPSSWEPRLSSVLCTHVLVWRQFFRESRHDFWVFIVDIFGAYLGKTF